MKNYLFLSLTVLLLAACSKSESEITIVQPEAVTSEFTKYRILKGNHYCDVSSIKAVNFKEQNFKVRFDSTAIYTTQTLDNQDDINKLFGFSEGMDPHNNSARIGWSYNKDSLRLYGYVYSNGVLFTQEISPCRIGEVLNCSIRPAGNKYFLQVNDKSVSLERSVLADYVEGYQLYPYFGGDESAPHNINIFISLLPGK